VTGGNVSLYNGTGEAGRIDSSINPTPLVGLLGVLDDVARATPSGWRQEGQVLYLLGRTRAELDGSQFAALAGHLGGLPPAVDMEAERVLAEVMIAASRDGLVDAAREVAEGGLITALALGALRYGVGARVALDDICAHDGLAPAEALLSESQARALCAVPRSEEQRWVDVLAVRGVPAVRIGVTDDTGVLEVQGQFTLPLDEARAVWDATLPARFS
jgi:phosphoribosylformylglycinamidine synthase